MRANPQYTYLIVGLKTKPQKNIINLPYINHKYIGQIYKTADVLVHPAVTEAFGLIYVEAMHYEIPVISFRTDGAEELIKSGQNGFIVEQRDIKGLEICLKNLFNNKTLYKNIITDAKITAKNYTFCHTVLNNYLNTIN